ncbi:putative ribonuclease H-like domain-containing protein [Tanacetum coccineum]
MCDKKNSVLFTDTECVVLSPDFKLLDENYVLFKVPRKDNMCSVDLKNIVPLGGLTCLFAKATLDESNLWHRRLGHINFKTMNKLVRGNLVRGLPLKIFENNHTCVACQKGKQHKASCKTKTGIKREFSVSRTPQQNGAAKRKNRTLIEAARTMLADLKLPTTFWTEAVNTACYVQNRVLVIKPHNKTPYELFLGRKPALSFMRPFRCLVTILNTLDHLDALTISMNYKPVVAGNQPNGNAGTKENFDAGQDGKKIVPDQSYILLPLLTSDPSLSKSSKDSPNAGFKPSREEEKMESKHPENEDIEVSNTEEPRVNQDHDVNVNNTNNINTVCPTVNAADIENNVVDEYIVYGCIDDPYMPNLEEIVYSDNDEEVGAEADINNLATTVPVSPIPTTRVHKHHPLEQIIGDIHSAPQTRRMTKNVTEHVEPKKVIQALTDPSWIEAMQDELLQFNLQKVWTLVDLTYGKRAIGTKWVYRNKKDDRVTRIEALGLFYLCASFKNFIVYQIDVKCAFLFRRGTIDKTLFIKKDKGDILLVQVYVDDIIFGSTKKSLCTEFEQMMHKRFQMSSMGELTFFLGLQVKQKDDGIFISQDKYVADILKKFDFATVKTASTPMETNKALLKDEEAADVDVHLYRSMIGSLMYLTASRPDIMFVVCACASDYAGASLDRKSTTRAEYVFAANCCGQVLWIQNQLLDYGYNFMNTKIFINNESTICIVKNPVFHSKTKNIEIRHHFIRDSYEKRLIQVIKIHIDHNVTDLLTKAFDVSKFQYLIPRYLERNGTAAKDEFQVSAVRVTYYWQEDKMERATTIASSLEAEQDSGNINMTQSMATLKESFPQGTDSVYESCIQQFWATAKAKTANREHHIQALVDKKKVIITEKSVRSDLMLDDAEGTKCLPNDVCASIPGQTSLRMPKHKGIYVTPSHTKKIFANMKREGKGFSRRITPLFQTMMVQAPKDMGEDSAAPTC